MVAVALLVVGCGGSDPTVSAEQASSPSSAPAASVSTASPGPAGPGSVPGRTERPSSSGSVPAGGKVSRLGGSAASTTSTAAPSVPPTPSGGEVRQWASEASATSNYALKPGDPWHASQAVGPPDAGDLCADNPKAWASLLKDEVAVLTVRFAEPVWASELTVHQTFNPGQVVKLEALGPGGASSVLYEGRPAAPGGCPELGYLKGLALTHPVDALAITVDQSVLGLGWIEIDAVELVGTAAT
jgi:hypothetical protein